MDQTLQAGENLTLNCTGVNNIDATQPLTINWMFIALDGDNTPTLYTINRPQVTQVEMDDNITVISYFTINGVVSSNSGEYGCYVFNSEEVRPVSANATVTVFCKHFINSFIPELIKGCGLGGATKSCTILLMYVWGGGGY